MPFLGRVGDKGYDHVIGITAADISTTAHGVYDWGIFGLGQMNGKACVLSTYRLKKAGKKLLSERIADVVVHEVGHTLGLQHCLTPKCVMNDAEGSIKAVDNSTGDFCKSCKAKIAKFLRP